MWENRSADANLVVLIGKCFSHTIEQENALKPWAHSTHLGVRDFPDGVRGNKLMEKWD